jgi:hypothetical protein
MPKDAQAQHLTPFPLSTPRVVLCRVVGLQFGLQVSIGPGPSEGCFYLRSERRGQSMRRRFSHRNDVESLKVRIGPDGGPDTASEPRNASAGVYFFKRYALRSPSLPLK